jgi:hypothetical protein
MKKLTPKRPLSPTTPTVLDASTLRAVRGGGGFIKLGEVDGESVRLTSRGG